MAFKFVVLLASMMVASAVVLPSGILQPTLLTRAIQPTILTKTLEPADTVPQYTFSYQVNDPTTGDIKSQEESRNGDVVKGAYALVDPDGLQRVVQYTSDGINGFNAVVSRTPIGKQVAVAPVIKTIQPTLIKSVPSLIQSPLTRISSLSPLGLGPSPLGVPLGLQHLIG